MSGAVRRLMAATFLLWFSLYTYPSFLQTYSKDALGAAPVMIGMITGSYGFTQMLLRIPLGIFSDMIRKRKPFLVLGMAASLLSGLGFLFVRSPGGALVFRGLAGVAASTWVTYSVLYSAYFRPDEVNAAISRLSFAQYISQVAAMLLGAYLAQRLGSNWAFGLGAGAAFLGAVLAMGIRDVPPSPDELPRTVRSLVTVVRDRTLLVSTALSTLFHFVCWGTVLGFTVNWASDEAGLTITQLGFLSVAYMLPNALISRVSGASMTDRFGERNVLLAGFLCAAAACFLYPAARSAATLFPIQVLFGVGMGLALPLTVSGAIRDIPSGSRGAAMGFYQSVYGLGMFVGPVAAGAVVEAFTAGENVARGYAANFVLMGCVSLVGALVAAIFVKKRG